MYMLSVNLRDTADSACRQGYSVMFPQFFRNTTEGMIRAEVGRGPPQRQGTAPAGYSGIPAERAETFSGPPVFLLTNGNYTEYRVP
jgi:hypothetical protein